MKAVVALVALFFALCSCQTSLELIQSTWLGGTDNYVADSVSDSNNNVYVLGCASSTSWNEMFPAGTKFNNYGCGAAETYSEIYLIKLNGINVQWYTCIGTSQGDAPDHVYTDDTYIYASVRAGNLPSSKSTPLPEGESGPAVVKINIADGTIAWSYSIRVDANDRIVGMGSAPNGGIYIVGATAFATIPISDTQSLECSPDGAKEIFSFGLNEDGSYKSAQCFGGAKDEEIYTSHFDKKSNKIYIPGASSSGTIAGVDLTPYAGPSGSAFFVVSLDTTTGNLNFEGAEHNPLSSSKGSWQWGTITESIMDANGLFHFVGEHTNNKTSVIITLDPATKNLTQHMHGNLRISAIDYDENMNTYYVGHNHGQGIPDVNGFLKNGTHFLQIFSPSGELLYSTHIFTGSYREFSADSLSIQHYTLNGKKYVLLASMINSNAQSLPEILKPIANTRSPGYNAGFIMQFEITGMPTPAPTTAPAPTNEPSTTTSDAATLVSSLFVALILVSLF